MKGPLAALLDTSSDESLLLPRIYTAHRPKMRYKSTVHICSLPKDVLLLLLSGLPLSDLVRMRRVNTFFHDLIDETPALWVTASLHSLWPTQSNFAHIQKAADCGNVEALLKLGVMYMYSECLPHPRPQLHITGQEAAEMFVRFEQLTPSAVPFTWVFYRPPWSPVSLNKTCCKSTVLQSLLNLAQNSNCSRSVYYCVGRTLYLFDDKDKLTEAFDWFKRAAQLGCAESEYMIWKLRYSECYMLDKATELAGVRSLRNLVLSQPGCLDAQIMLCKLYAEGRLGGISAVQAAHFVRDFFHSSKPSNPTGTFPLNGELTTRVRQILVDWLVEVSNLKHFSTEAVHLAINTVDRYLLTVPSSKAELQLVGITALLLSTRYLGKDILTVREAAWVTDNTYQYEDVVHMMAQIVATLRGKFKVPTVIDFLQILLRVAAVEESIVWLAQYFCDIVLLHPDFGRFTLSQVAASSMVLAGLVIRKDCIWNSKLEHFTGFRIQDLLACITLLHAKCSISNELEDFKSRKLTAIILKYKQSQYCYVSDVQLISRKELQEKLEINDSLYLKSLCSRWSIYEHVVRTLCTQSALNSHLNKSVCSGYDGDDELDCDITEFFDCNESMEDKIAVTNNADVQVFSAATLHVNIPEDIYAKESSHNAIAQLELPLQTLKSMNDDKALCHLNMPSPNLKVPGCVQSVLDAKQRTSGMKSVAKEPICNDNALDENPPSFLLSGQCKTKKCINCVNACTLQRIPVNSSDKENVVVCKKLHNLAVCRDTDAKGFTRIICSKSLSLAAHDGQGICSMLVQKAKVSVSHVTDSRLQPLQCHPSSSLKKAPGRHKRKPKTCLENNSKTVILDCQKDS